MIEVIRLTIQKHRLIVPSEKLVVGVSGGTDSLALLHLLKNLSVRIGFFIHAATLDHQLRGKESAEDVNYVVSICGEWSIPVTTKKVNVSELSRKTRTSVEVAARMARYEFFAEVAHQVGASCVAVAHHADDQAETVLMRLLRGSGGKGLEGMALQSTLPGHPDIRLIRPLILVPRSMLEDYCRQHNLSPRQDSTNQDTTILRNRIRYELLPYLNQYNPRISQVLSQVAEIAGVENEYFEREIEQIMAEGIVSESSGWVNLNREKFRQLHPALQRRLVIGAVDRLGAADDLDYQHILDAIGVAMNGQQGAISLFGGELRLRVDYDFVVIERKNTTPAEVGYPLLDSNHEIEVAIPGIARLNDWMLEVSAQSFPASESFPVCSLAIPEKTVLTLRHRLPGDQFAPLGMQGHTQKLNRLMINRKIPRPLRDQIPLICLNGEIAALPLGTGWLVSEKFRIKKDSGRIIYIRFMENS